MREQAFYNEKESYEMEMESRLAEVESHILRRILKRRLKNLRF